MPSTRLLGLVGGTSWVSTIDYYRYLNEGVGRALGGLHSARLLLHSVDFADYVANNTAGRWDRTEALLRAACHGLVAAGAEGLMLCANTSHAVIAPLKAEFGVPFIDLVEETAKAILDEHAGLRRVALLGTQFTMELPFYREGLARYGIEARVPRSQAERDFIQRTLRDELGRGHVVPKTRAAYLEIIENMVGDGCEGVVFGCTEIPLLLKAEDVPVPSFDTTRIHVQAGLRFLLAPTAEPQSSA